MDMLNVPWIHEFIFTSLMAVNKSHIPFIRRSTVSTFENVTILDSVRFVDRIDFQVLSEVDDMLLPFSNRREVDLFRRAAYARYRSSKRNNWVTILARRTRCRRIMNLSEMKKMIRSFHRKVEVLSFELTSFKYQVDTMRNTDILISIHGAALVNIVFMQPGSTLIELIHPLMRAPFYELLSVFASLRYVDVRNFTKIDECSTVNWDPHLDTNLYVDLSILHSIILGMIWSCL